MTKQTALKRKGAKPWSPRAALAPRCRRDGDGFLVVGNGSEGCYGGWDLTYGPPAQKGRWVEVRVKARWADLRRSWDSVHAGLFFGDPEQWTPWEPMLPIHATKRHVTFGCRAPVPAGAAHLTLRLCIAWSDRGQIRWFDPEVTVIPPPRPRTMRLGAAGGLPGARGSLRKNAEFYLDRARLGADAGVDLLVLPEVILSMGRPCTSRRLHRIAVEVPGPAIEPFQDLARRRQIALCFSVHERNGDLVHNTAVLIAKSGRLAGTYRKVHLALPGEVWQGVTPGHEFGVFDLEGAKVAMNICMDSSAADSARTPAAAGAEILCMPIMGDHRATTVVSGRSEWSYFDPDHWRMIQSVRAMDNQIFLAISRNAGPGSGVFGLRGRPLAMSLGEPVVSADVDLNDLPRSWTGGTLRGIDRCQRRDGAYWRPPADPFE